MKDIFISKPTWIAEEFKPGHESFLTLIKSYDLNPRTLGESDYATESPLDEVIAIMNQCVGAIILGYPQIIIKNGTLEKNNIDSNSLLVLASEWNHIEAGIAYFKKLPLLVIHHTDVSSRGIFCMGSLNKFLHKVDMSNKSWASDTSIIGALASWRKKLPEKPPFDSGLSILGSDLEFEKASGTYISKGNGLRYCTKCWHSSAEKIPLKEQENGWSCSGCGEFYPNPNWNPPRKSAYNNDVLTRGMKFKRKT